MKTEIFNLAILPLNNILPHEKHDESRSKNLIKSFQKDKTICNPIIVAPLNKSLYIQLDGMNRYSTFKRIGLKSILCQIVDYQDMENVELSSWAHFINVNSVEFIKYLRKLKDIRIHRGIIDDVRNRYVTSEAEDKICSFVSENLDVYLITYGGNLLDKIKVLNRIVDYYNRDIVRSVLPDSPTRQDIRNLFKEHFKHMQMVVFPTFTRHQIMKVVRKGSLFPAGITRHIIKRRCLNINLPLKIFSENLPIKKQNEYLEDNLRRRKFRLYEEPTVYFE